MKLIVLNKVAINIDHIDGVVPNENNKNYTSIFIGGSDAPFITEMPFEEVVDEIYKVCGGENERV